MTVYQHMRRAAGRTLRALAGRPDVGYALLGDNRGLVLTHAGDRILVDTRDLSVAPSLILYGQWERTTGAVIRRLTPRGGIAVDIGANVGCHTLALARAVGEDGTVHAFEANPRLARLLRGTIALNGLQRRVMVHNLAVFDRDGTLELSVDPDFLGGGHVAHGVESEVCEQFTVASTTLPSALPEVERIDMLRLDIEGTEPFALRGAEPLIRRSPDLRIITEWDPVQMGPRCDLAEYVRWLCGLGFRFWHITPWGRLAPLAEDRLATLTPCDIVMCRRAP